MPRSPPPPTCMLFLFSEVQYIGGQHMYKGMVVQRFVRCCRIYNRHCLSIRSHTGSILFSGETSSIVNECSQGSSTWRRAFQSQKCSSQPECIHILMASIATDFSTGVNIDEIQYKPASKTSRVRLTSRQVVSGRSYLP